MITEASILIFLMVLFRMLAFFGVVKVFFPSGTPKYAKLLFSLTSAFIMFPIINKVTEASFNGVFSIVYYGANEILIGLLMGYVTNLCFNFIKMAGQFLDIHVGFAMSSLIDPISSENITLIEKLIYMTSILLFLMINGHHMLIKAFIGSYKVLGIGQTILVSENLSKIMGAFIYFFNLGIRISLPVTLVILIINFVLGLASRAVPQLNVMILGMPIKIIVGLVVLILSMPLMAKLFKIGFEEIPNHILKVLSMVGPVAFIFADNGDKTEEATPKKKDDARKKGQVARSKELTSTITLICITFVLLVFGEYSYNQLGKAVDTFLSSYLNVELSFKELSRIGFFTVSSMAKVFLPIALPIMLVGVIGNLAQTGFLHTTEPLKPKFSKLNPLKGFKNFFSARAFVDLLKNIAIISVLLYVGYNFCIENFNDVLNLSNLSLNALPKELNNIIIKLLFKFSIIMVIISVIDYGFQRYQHNKDLKMSKQEIKEEYKQMEGDPQIKGKIRQKQREMAMQRMMQSVPDATVVITNPTHFAVALKYNEDGTEAPKLVAKGADNMAFKIKEIALSNNVPIFENKPLARTIYHTVEVEEEIPEELYQAVAEILAFIYKASSSKK